MKKITTTMAALLTVFSLDYAVPHTPENLNYKSKPILADLTLLKALKIPTMIQDQETGVGYTVVTPDIEALISNSAHLFGRCGNYEALDSSAEMSLTEVTHQMNEIREVQHRNNLYKTISFRALNLVFNPDIQTKMDLVSADNIKDSVTWLSSYKSRYNKGANPNAHVLDMKTKIEELLKTTKANWTVTTIDHRSTAQKSLRVQFLGKNRPNEIIVLGAHLDSISSDSQNRAPGADDNASGSASILEALRILAESPQTARTLEFFFYAGEESGLLGSAEIAKTYKAQKKDVVAVMQLDMTMFPGDGELVIGSINDFTSTWLQDYLKEINTLYTKIKILDSTCGYGCSDHASWFRNGYPSFFPVEATMEHMNHNLHTAFDTISSKTSFTHSAIFSKIALVFALDLGNSEQRQPY